MQTVGITAMATITAVSCFLGGGCSRAPVQAASHEAKPAAPAVSAAPATATAAGSRIVRATGVVQAVRTLTVRVPQLSQVSGRSPQLTITTLVPNGTAVKKDDILVEFDQTAQIDDAREAQSLLDQLQHQLEEKRALVNNDSVKRLSLIREAESELAKAELQLRKGPVLSELDKRRNEVRAAGARERLVSLGKSHRLRVKAEEAAVQVLELKSGRQKLVVARLKSNIDSLTIHAPHDGMAALESVFRSGSMGPPQVGDQVWPNQPIVRVFDPSEMVVEIQVNEPDVAALGSMSRATVHLDAYPNVAFDANLESASPVATGGLESPVKSFLGRFRIAQHDPRLLPDLSASLEIEMPPADPSQGKGAQ